MINKDRDCHKPTRHRSLQPFECRDQIPPAEGNLRLTIQRLRVARLPVDRLLKIDFSLGVSTDRKQVRSIAKEQCR